MQCIRVCGRALEMHQKSREFDIQGHTLTPLGPVCICRDFVIWRSVHGADWVEAGHRAQHGHSNSVQNTLRDRCGDARVWVGSVRACLRPGTYHVLVLMELRRICRMGAQGDGSLLNALSRKCYMCMLQYVHRGTLP